MPGDSSPTLVGQSWASQPETIPSCQVYAASAPSVALQANIVASSVVDTRSCSTIELVLEGFGSQL